ncbi:MAG: B12-binding domain-containing radical SAM protein [Chloroflexi bacterium]|nr:B12-binding domain-containing radical SAM protein [Chloroflexota bacterium]MCI0576283.1 B12-binding domain-containing radical SAM protein [Chloroflexota bacterium]MCI0644521.1 B12-binding domain-containing radical SAM protein [Chloroflexota bacterium]MCI0728790.1 B12-binding domain-containing radical SAM protein [Chloroflexota bacterium]
MLGKLWPRAKQSHASNIVWLDLGDLGDLVHPNGPHEQWQDHGLGLLRTILHQNGILTDLLSTRAVTSWNQLRKQLEGYDMLIMNVRSYTFPVAYRSAKIFKEVNPNGLVLTGGMHATVAPDEMTAVAEFDKICQGPGEKTIVDLVRAPQTFPRLFMGVGAKSMAEWPMIDRTLWPRPASDRLAKTFNWPLEPECGWGPPAVATILTSRVCPWQCVFCNENSYIGNMGRRPVEMIIDELNYLDRTHGPLGSVVIHDSMFFQNPSWLEEWIEKYPSKANKLWPYWAAARADTVRQWPELFAALVRETNWHTVSIGFESGSDRVLRILNKECTEEDNYFAIDLLHRIGDEMEAEGKQPPVFWSNIMLGIPGETHEDAFKTMRMLKYMRRVMPSIAFYAPYPGSALGHQLIAEGRSLMTKDNYHRFPDDEKVKGVDYQFYRDLLAGRYDDEINKGLDAAARRRQGVFTGALTKA